MSHNGDGVTKITGRSRPKPYSRTRKTLSTDVEVLILALRTVSATERMMFERWYVHGENEESIAASCETTVEEFRAARSRLYNTYFHLRSLVCGADANPAQRCA